MQGQHCWDHLEGPFINSQRRGAQREDAIIPPSVDVMAHLFGRAKVCCALLPSHLSWTVPVMSSNTSRAGCGCCGRALGRHICRDG